MGDATQDRTEAAELPDGDVIAILLEQHARIREGFAAVADAQGEAKKERFDELRVLLAVHETAEEMILRPASLRAAGAEVHDARNREEAEANKVLARLERLDVSSAEFDELFASFRDDVVEHAEHEEDEEFPQVIRACDEQERRTMGRALLAVEAVAPTHPHPSTAGSPLLQWAVGPFASIVDRTRDAITKALG